VVAKREAEELLMIEEADAWFEYLEATRSQAETRYHEIEPWAWARLSQRLRAIRARRARLRPAAAYNRRLAPSRVTRHAPARMNGEQHAHRRQVRDE